MRPLRSIHNESLLLQKSARWAGPIRSTKHPDSLQERLEEFLVLEIREDGGQHYLHFTGRGLYRHVIDNITHHSSKNKGRTGGSPEGVTVPGAPALVGGDPLLTPPLRIKMSSRLASSAGIGQPAAGEVTYRERLGGYLHPRDMRKVGSTVSSEVQ
jgi:hypothetical protein